MKPVCQITTSSFGKNDAAPLRLLEEAGFEVRLNPHGRALKEDEALALLADVDFLIAGTEPLTKRVLANAPRLKIMARVGSGINNIDLDEAKRRGIVVTRTAEAPAQAVAELTLGLMLDLCRHLSQHVHDMRQGVWTKRMGQLLSKKTVGIVGFGAVGRSLAKLLAPFECRLIGVDPYVSQETMTLNQATKMELSEALEIVDLLSIHAAAPDDSPLIDATRLSKMKPSALLINTSRGTVIDEAALAAALKAGHLAGAALDVFADEPYKGPLSELDSVILTPHIGTYAAETRVQMETAAAQSVIDFHRS